LSLKLSEIEKLIEQFENETKAIRNDVLEMCWHMRGAVSYEEGMLLSYTDREIINKIIKGHIETTQKSGLPYF
jgi:predicted Ser/Thr protein kinase